MHMNAQAATCIDREGDNSIVVLIGVKDRLPESAWQIVSYRGTVFEVGVNVQATAL